VVTVIRQGRFRICVYAEVGHRHHRPHCHVYWTDGSSSVDLQTLTVLDGHSLPADALALLRTFQTVLWFAWYTLNPGTPAP
jgi:hypothetical protein